MCVAIGFERLHIICHYHNNKVCPIVPVFSFLSFHTHSVPSAKLSKFADMTTARLIFMKIIICWI